MTPAREEMHQEDLKKTAWFSDVEINKSDPMGGTTQ